MVKYEHLLGIKFSHGVDDCYGLVRKFYGDNFGLQMTNYARPEEWWSHGMNLYMENLDKEGFQIVGRDSIRELRPADLFLISIRAKVPNHAAINLGDGRILHHFFGRFSEVTSYKGLWRNHTMCVVRHPDVPDLRQEAGELDLMEQLPAHKRRQLGAL